MLSRAPSAARLIPPAIEPVSISVPSSVSGAPRAIVLAPVSVQVAPLMIETLLKLLKLVPRPLSVPAPAPAASCKVPPAPSTDPMKTAWASSISVSADDPSRTAMLPVLSIVPKFCRTIGPSAAPSTPMYPEIRAPVSSDDPLTIVLGVPSSIVTPAVVAQIDPVAGAADDRTVVDDRTK